MIMVYPGVPLVTGLLFLLHNTAAQPQGRALNSSPTLNKVSGGKQQFYDDYFQEADDMDHFYKKPVQMRSFQEADDMDHFYKKPVQMREFQEKKSKHNDRRTYNYRNDDILVDSDQLYETQFEEKEQYPYNSDSKQSQDDVGNKKYGGLGVILGRQNPLRQLG